MNFNELEVHIYEDHLKWLIDEASALENAEAKGIEKGKKEEKLAIAKSMLSKGIDVKLIEELTGLDKHTIEGLVK